MLTYTEKTQYECWDDLDVHSAVCNRAANSTGPHAPATSGAVVSGMRVLLKM